MPAANDQTPELIVLPDWGAFQLAMLTDQAYFRVSQFTENQRAVSRIETYFSAEVENWPVAAMLWGYMLQGCPEMNRPTAEEARKWTEIAAATNMPITFTETGHLTPASED